MFLILGDGSTAAILHSKHLTTWSDDRKKWPPIESSHIGFYLLQRKACDERQAMNWKSTEAYLYVTSGFVHDTKICVVENLFYVKSKVHASQNKDFHNAWVCIEKVHGNQAEEYEILGGECSCKGGLTGSCSHVSAILYQIYVAERSSQVGQACTDITCQWNAGSKNIEPDVIENVVFEKTPLQKFLKRVPPNVKTKKPLIQKTSSFYKDDEGYQEIFKSGKYSVLTQVQNTILNRTVHPVDLPHEFHQHDVHSLVLSCATCDKFYKTFVDLSVIKLSQLAEKTQAQSESDLWASSRRIRITASMAGSVPRKCDPENFLHRSFFKPFKGTAATEQGIANEPLAIQTLEHLYGFQVKRRGTIVSTDYPWLSCSPDGTYDSDQKILEVKCPIKMDDAHLKTMGVYPSSEEDGEYVLRPGQRHYYLQIQLNMFCTGSRNALLYVWSQQRQVQVPVSYNEQYVKNEIKRLKRFYFSFFLPRCADLYNQNQLFLSDDYLKLCNL